MSDREERPSEALFTREEVLGGLPLPRARALLFHIESLAVQRANREREIIAVLAAPESGVSLPIIPAGLGAEEPGASDPEDEFLASYGRLRHGVSSATIRQIERYARDWAPMVPENPRLRAALARLLGQKYRFTRRAVPGLRAALGLDTEPVQQAYRQAFDEPLEAIYAPQVSLRERLGWALTAFGKRLDALPPSWFAFAFTLTETVGVVILALPIAMALVGPLAGAAILAIVGLINTMTIVSMAEAVARSGPIRYGHAYLGRLVSEYLGPAGSFLFTAGGVTLSFLALPAFYIGFSTVLADATRLPQMAWAAALFGVSVFVVTRRSLHMTAASAFLIGVVNIGLVLTLSGLALAHARPEHLAYVNVPFLGGRGFDTAVLELVFGVGLAAFFGHLSIGNGARLILHRDPSARGLIVGCAAAQFAAIFLYMLFVIAVNGAVGPQLLAGYGGTALEPLARVAGPGIRPLGVLFVLLGMGFGSIHYALALYNFVSERLPARPRFLATLAAGGDRLVLEPRSGADEGLRIGLTYRGLSGGRPRFRADVQAGARLRTVERTLAGEGEFASLLDAIPEAREAALTLEMVEAGGESASFVVHSTLRARYEAGGHGAGLTRLLELPGAEGEIIPWILRRGEVTLAEVVAHTGGNPGAARAALDTLVARGMLQVLQDGPEPRYRTRLARRRGSSLPAHLWEALEQPAAAAEAAPEEARRSDTPARRDRFILTDQMRQTIAMMPLVVSFLLTTWVILTGKQTFAGLLNILGLVVMSAVGGIFPVLMLRASRRKGEFVPAFIWRPLGSTPVLALLYLTFLSSLILHGVFIWKSLPARAAALGTAVLMVGGTIAMARRGAFRPRLVVELRQAAEGPEPPLLSVLAGGERLEAEVQMEYADGSATDRSTPRRVTVSLPETPARELKVWAHRVTPEGESHAARALLELQCGDRTWQVDLGLSDGQALLPLPGGACRLQITLGGTGE